MKYPVQIPDIEFWKGMIPCQAACPIHTDAGKYVQLIAEGKYEESYLTTRSPNPFASICGRVWAALGAGLGIVPALPIFMFLTVTHFSLSTAVRNLDSGL